MRSLNTKFKLSSFKTVGGIWGDRETDNMRKKIRYSRISKLLDSLTKLAYGG